MVLVVPGDRGRSALDYLIKVRGMGFQEAVLHLMDCMGQMPELAPPRSQSLGRKTPLPFQLPQRNRDNRRVLAYLTGRGIALPLLQGCIRAGTLYEDKRHNCVFVGFDGAGVPRYGFIRSSDPGSTFLRDADGSDKRYAFHMAAKAPSDTLHVFESAIDLLSISPWRWNRGSHGNGQAICPFPGICPSKDNPALPMALEQYLSTHPQAPQDHPLPGQRPGRAHGGSGHTGAAAAGLLCRSPFPGR